MSNMTDMETPNHTKEAFRRNKTIILHAQGCLDDMVRRTKADSEHIDTIQGIISTEAHRVMLKTVWVFGCINKGFWRERSYSTSVYSSRDTAIYTGTGTLHPVLVFTLKAREE